MGAPLKSAYASSEMGKPDKKKTETLLQMAMRFKKSVMENAAERMKSGHVELFEPDLHLPRKVVDLAQDLHAYADSSYTKIEVLKSALARRPDPHVGQAFFLLACLRAASTIRGAAKQAEKASRIFDKHRAGDDPFFHSQSAILGGVVRKARAQTDHDRLNLYTLTQLLEQMIDEWLEAKKIPYQRADLLKTLEDNIDEYDVKENEM